MLDKALYEKLRLASVTGTELTLAGDEAKAVVDAPASRRARYAFRE